MKRDLKRAFSFILVLALVIGLMPAPSALAIAPGMTVTASSVDNSHSMPKSLTDGAIWTDKVVGNLGEGNFLITLSAIGQNYEYQSSENPNPIDVVLVLDLSLSMDSYSRLNSMKTAATSAASIILGKTGNRVAIVSYSDMGQIESGFTDSFGTIQGVIHDLDTIRSTNIQNGLYNAQQLIQARGSSETNKPVIVLMSDGSPTYYHTKLTNHSTYNRAGTGNPSGTNGTYVWQTVLQAAQVKQSIPNLDIYTIGFGIDSDQYAPYARATLAPDATNTAAYRTTFTYSAQKRDLANVNNVRIQFYRTRPAGSSGSSGWSNWSVVAEDNNIIGSRYIPPSVGGTWTNVTNQTYPLNNITSASNRNNGSQQNTQTWTVSGTEYQAATFNATVSGTIYRNIDLVRNGTVPFNSSYKYWTNSTITGNDPSEIIAAFVNLANQLTTFKPSQKVVSGSAVYNNIVITDVLGSAFELAEPAPSGVTVSGSSIIWTIDGQNFITMNAGSTIFDSSKMTSVSFRVRIKDSVTTAGTYYTNQSAAATFNVDEKNPAYTGTSITQELLNNGQATLAYTPVDVNITIEKTVAGAAVGTTTFAFNVYDSDMVFLTSASIEVTGADTQSTSVSLREIPGQKFINGEATFYVRETGTAPEFWTYDNTYAKAVEITRDNPTGKVSFLNSYNPKGTLVVNKVWPQGNPDNVTSVAFYLESRVGSGEWSRDDSSVLYTLTKDDGWTYSIPGLSIEKEYRVVEMPGSLTQDYFSTTTPGSIAFSATDLEKEITISNQYITPTGDITIKKNWIGGTSDDLPDDVTFIYDYDNGSGITSGSISLTSSEAEINGGILTWKIKKSGLGFGTYTFTEQDVQDYTATATTQSVTIAKDPVASRSAVVTFENTYVTPSGVLAVEKQWVGENGDTRFRPSSVVFKLFQKIAGSDEETQYGGENTTYTLNTANQWMKTFDNLAWGQYRVEEITVPDYTTTYSALSVTLDKGTKNDIKPRTGLITISNLFDNPKGKITVQKTWVESGLESIDRPSEIIVTLYRNTGNGPTYYDSVTFGGVDTSYTFKELPLDGTYTVTESASSDEDIAKLSAYAQSVTYSDDENGIKLSPSPFEREGTVFLKNTCARGTITVNKAWEDGENPDAEKPAAATVTLYQKRTYVVEEETEDPDNPIVIDDEGTTEPAIVITTHSAMTLTAIDTKEIDRSASPAYYSVVFYDLPLGKEYSYYVEETAIPFYDTVYSDGENESDDPEKVSLVLTEPDEENENSDNGTITITNTYTDPRGKILVSKTWDHGYNPAPPSEVTVELYKVVDNTLVYITEKTFSENCEFDGLTLGAVYTVREQDVAKYRTTYDPDDFRYSPVKNYNTEDVDAGSISIKNEYIPETGSLKVTKEWVDNTGGEVTITLTRYYRDGDSLVADEAFNAAPPSVVLEGDDWTDTFSGLDVYGPGGVKYEYRAVESGSDLWMYTPGVIQDKQLTSGEPTELVITNTYTPTQGALTITKIWQNGTDHPDTINYQLYVNGIAQDGYRTLSAPTWTDVLTGLDVTKSYSVREVGVPEEYDVTYSTTGAVTFTKDSLEKSITITNSRTVNNPELKLTKEVGKDAVILSTDGTAQFTYTLTITNTGNRTLTNIYVDDQMTASGTAVAADIEYVSAASLELVGSNGAKIVPLATTLAPGASTSAVYTVIVDQAGEYDNTAIAYGDYGQTTISTEPAEEKAFVKDLDLMIEKTVLSERNIRGSGGSFIYQITVRNASEFGFTNVSVQDVMTASNSNATMSYSNGGEVEYLPEEHRFVIGSLDADSDDVVFTYTVTVSGTGTYDNTATVTGHYENDLGSGMRSDSDSESVTVTRRSRPNPPDDPEEPDDPDDPDIEIPEEDVPEGTIPEVILPDDQIPAAPLPKTGGLDSLLLYGLGALLIGSGMAYKLRNRKNKEEK